MKYTLYLSQLLVSYTLAELSSIHAVYVVPHALLPSVHRSTKFVRFIMAGYLFISSHPLPTLLESELLFLTNSLRMPCEVRRSVDDGLVCLLAPAIHHTVIE